MPERERPQERAERRRGKHAVADQFGGAPRAQQVAVVDAVGAERHRRDQRHRLRALQAGAGTITEIDGLVDELLGPKALGKRRDQRDPGAGDRPLIVKTDVDRVQSGRPAMLHHEGDLLLQDPGCRYIREKPCSGGHSSLATGRHRSSLAVDRG
ncbi:hypothetical protein [Conexibacter sp. W3-3-2]|uniref:hypothetical protein n=1 Tax=Conexibacter sp. W3-3-2 TaxID=2675227 RepID=UPI001E4985F9|nr:hypothetical protein [Conexibacter sp. W3-3-2]